MNHDRKWAALAVLAAGLSLIVLDGTIVGVALPAIIADLRLDLTDAQWVNSLYSVVFAALLLTFGRLGDRFGRRSLFLAGVTVFVAGSVVAAFASGAEQLIASRALQGVGGALVLPSTRLTFSPARWSLIRTPRSSVPMWHASDASCVSRARPMATFAGLPPTCSFSPSRDTTMSMSASPATMTGSCMCSP